MLVHHPFDSFSATVEQFITRRRARRERARDQDDAVSHVGRHGDRARTDGGGGAGKAGGGADRASGAIRRGEQHHVGRERSKVSACTSRTAWPASRRTRRRRSSCAGRRTALGGTRTSARGNYNSKTARIYTDIGLFTCSPSIGADLSDLFNALTGFSRQRLYRKLIVAPGDMRERFLELIEREATACADGKGRRGSSRR